MYTSLKKARGSTATPPRGLTGKIAKSGSIRNRNKSSFTKQPTVSQVDKINDKNIRTIFPNDCTLPYSPDFAPSDFYKLAVFKKFPQKTDVDWMMKWSPKKRLRICYIRNWTGCKNIFLRSFNNIVNIFTWNPHPSYAHEFHFG